VSAVSDKKPAERRQQPPNPSRAEEALQVVQEYIDDLRATIEKLRRKLN
jgi:hypothetical protein